jgi:hypothetical protein
LRRKEDAAIRSNSPHKLSFTPRKHGDTSPSNSKQDEDGLCRHGR